MGWTWHIKVFFDHFNRTVDVLHVSGGRRLTEHAARTRAASMICFGGNFKDCPSWSVEAYVVDPDGVAHPVAEQGDVWWPRLGQEK